MGTPHTLINRSQEIYKKKKTTTHKNAIMQTIIKQIIIQIGEQYLFHNLYSSLYPFIHYIYRLSIKGHGKAEANPS